MHFIKFNSLISFLIRRGAFLGLQEFVHLMSTASTRPLKKCWAGCQSTASSRAILTSGFNKSHHRIQLARIVVALGISACGCGEELQGGVTRDVEPGRQIVVLSCIHLQLLLYIYIYVCVVRVCDCAYIIIYENKIRGR